MPVTGSKRERRSWPLSTTMRTPSIVRLVSAMLVASTILRSPLRLGWIAASCSCGDKFTEQRQHSHARRQRCFFQETLRATNLALAGKKREHITGLVLDRACDGASDDLRHVFVLRTRAAHIEPLAIMRRYRKRAALAL